MSFKLIEYPKHGALSLQDFKAMDYAVVNDYAIPIELMMENAGLHLARLIAHHVQKNHAITIGVGNGNNGGGGLVAARRLLAWGYCVHLDFFNEINKELPQSQLKRALAFGANTQRAEQTDVWVDCYLGFSQRLPLTNKLKERLEQINESNKLKISLDIPTGLSSNLSDTYFHADKVLTIAAPKTLLYGLPTTVDVYVADIGIPREVYTSFGAESLPFDKTGIVQLKR